MTSKIEFIISTHILIFENNKFTVDTNKLRAFIDEHGVDVLDANDNHLISYINYMTIDQIDLIMDQKPTLYFDEKSIIYLFDFNSPKWIRYVFGRMLEQNGDFFIVTHKSTLVTPFRPGKQEKKVNYLGYLKHIRKHLGVVYRDTLLLRSTVNEVIRMTENHEKKSFKLFDLLKHHIE